MCVSVETALGVDWSGYTAHEATCPPGISVSCAAMSTSKAVQIRAESRPCFCVLVKMFACPHVGVSLCVFIPLCILEASGPHVHGSDVLMFSPSPHLSASSFSAFCPRCCGHGYLEAPSSYSPSARGHQRPLGGTSHPLSLFSLWVILTAKNLDKWKHSGSFPPLHPTTPGTASIKVPFFRRESEAQKEVVIGSI